MIGILSSKIIGSTEPIVIPDGLLYYYKLNGNTNDTLLRNDASSNEITYEQGSSGDKAAFNDLGTSNIIIPTTTSLDFCDGTGNDLPYSFIFEFSILSQSNQYFFWKEFDSNNRGYIISYSPGFFRVWMYNGDGSGRILANLDFTATLNQTYVACITYDASKLVTGIKVYVDNTELTGGNLNSGTYIGLSPNDGDLWVGDSFYSASVVAMFGAMESIGIFGKELSVSEVEEYTTKLMNGQDLIQ